MTAASSPELLERSDHLASLGERLANVRESGAGSVVLVGGEAGVGKTALLRRFCAGAGTRVLWGACDGLFTPRPLGPLLDVAQSTGDEFASLVETGALPHEVTRALLRDLTLQAPSVLVLEDVHWADEATLDVIKLLARRIQTVSALALVTYRDDELDRLHPLRTVLGEVGRFEGTKRLRLPPLSADAVAQLAETYSVDAAELYRTTAGNPFFVTEVLAAHSDEIPATVRDAVLARASRLSAPARSLLETIAVSPQQAEVWLIEALAGIAPPGMEECLDSGMLTTLAAGVRFRHELARIAIEDSIPPTRRIELHRTVLAALVARAPDTHDSARLAHHAEGAGDREAVLHFAPAAAARAATLGAHREAAAQYARALRFGELLGVQERAALLGRRAEQCYMCAQFDDAIEAQLAAHECLEQLDDPYAVGDSLRTLTRLLAFAGRYEEPDRLALEAVELLETLPPRRELALAYGAVAQRRMAAHDTDAAVDWGVRAIALARRLDDPEALAYALTTVGAAEQEAGRAGGKAKLEEARELAHRHGLDELVGRAYFQLAHEPLRSRRFAVAREALDPGLAYCSERGLETWRQYLLACRAELELEVGDWQEAGETVQLILSDPRAAPVAYAWALATLGRLRARRGDPDASGPLDEAHELTRSSGEIFRIGPVATARAEAGWLLGDGEAVAAATEAALSLALEREAWWEASELVYWRRQTGIHDEIDSLPADNPFVRALNGASEASAQRWRALGCPYEAALALADGDDPAALHRAVAELRSLGAEPAAAVVTRRLRDRGERGIARGPRSSTRANPAGLTARQLEVLQLVAEGLRNGEIAGRLVVSERTVDHHVAAILRKLGARTRSEASAEALRRGLIQLPRKELHDA